MSFCGRHLAYRKYLAITLPTPFEIEEFLSFKMNTCCKLKSTRLIKISCPSILLLDFHKAERLPGCLLAVLPSFENSLILLPLCSINNGIMAFRNLGNTASKQLGTLWNNIFLFYSIFYQGAVFYLTN